MKAKKRKAEANINPAKRDSYLFGKYCIRFDEHEKKEKRQGNKCAICRRPPVNLPLAQDHWHKLANLEIKTWKIPGSGGIWYAWNVKFDLLGFKLHTGQFFNLADSKRAAVKPLRQKLKRMSNRGLLCWACNTGLQKWRDHPENILRAAKYLKSYMEGLKNGLDYNERT